MTSTTRGGVEHLGFRHTEMRRGMWWTTFVWRGVGSKDRKTTPATTSTTHPQCANYWALLMGKECHK